MTSPGPPSVSQVCSGCAAVIDRGVPVCPRCGRVVTAAVSPAARSGRTRQLLLLLGLAVVLALVVRWRRSPTAGDGCKGGENPSVTWETEDRTAPRVASGSLNAIDPNVTPHVRLAVVRHTGNAVYAQKSDHEYGHNHQPIIDLGHKKGGNAYFHAPAHAIAGDQFEVSTTIAIAHTGPIPRAIKDKYFAAGQAVQIFHTIPGSVAEQAGLAVNDLVVKVNGLAPSTADDVLGAAAVVPQGGTLTFEVLRAHAPRTVTMIRRDQEKFGFHAMQAPILEVVP